MSVVQNNLLMTPEGYTVSNSVRLRSSASAYFNRTPASAGNRQIMTFSWWIKLGNTAGAVFGAPATTNPRMQIYYNGPSDGRFELYQSDGGGTQVCYTLTSARYRDPSAWYHFVIAIDTTQATASNRIKWYVNGVQLTAFDTAAYPAQNTNMEWNAAAIHNIGRQPNGGSYFDGYLTDVNFIDGQTLTPSSFGETDAITGVWKPKKYAGTYGTNGFFLNFSNAASTTTIGYDYSGNGNNWTSNNISVTSGVTYDSMIDTPTMYADGGNGRGNYAVLNPLDKYISDGSITNTNLTLNGTSNWNACRGNWGMSSGKWYWETVHSVYNQSICGIADQDWPASTYYPGYSSTGYSAGFGNAGYKYVDGAAGAVYGTAFVIGDVIGYALDMDAGTLTCYINGVSQGTMVSGLTGTIFPAIAAANGAVINANFGQRPFSSTPPTGFKALNTQNLPDSTIKKGNAYFDATTYTGNGTSQSIVNSGSMQPDLVWTKGRSGASNHSLVDSVRGIALQLSSNQTVAEVSDATEITALNSNGFSVGNSSGAGYSTNANGTTYVGWQWKESASAGFDIVTYTGNGTSGRTVAHSLGVAPAMTIIKNRSGTNYWICWHKSLSSYTSNVYLNGTDSVQADGNFTAAPSSTVLTLDANKSVNVSANNYVAYLFAEVAGFSKFGSYTGNGSADGPFVYCGFKPRWLMVKRTDSTGNWALHDTARDTYNSSNSELFPNLSNAEWSGTGFDLVSNGFKPRNTYTDINGSGATYIYLAIAENPFKNSLAR